ncbi:unnamed protein product [Caenorhabditis angaria]|uniref:Rab-GAP TBC domain-containing protein n=1 Tax=Caenorhabditis angaria TaxID=860376 RepID=A0A9P1J0P1_9PELO|nr:unnamed protein product [Caenorhabditis angaria]
MGQYIDIQHAFSISGFLHMKYLGGALSLWRPRRRYYFAIDEIAEELIYHKSEVDFTVHRIPIGSFPISTAVITLDDNNNCAFILHVSGRSVEFEADNEKSCRCWLDAFSNRYSEAEKQKFSQTMLRKTKKSSSLPDHESSTEQPVPPRKFSFQVRPTKRDLFASPSKHPEISENYLLDEEMDDWVTQWLRNEKFHNFSTLTDPTTPTSTNMSKKSLCSDSADTEELDLLREITNNQKKRIEEMKHEMHSLTMHLDQMRRRCDSTSGTDRDTLSSQNKFLNSEILRMSAKCEIYELQTSKFKKENKKLEEDLHQLRCDYVYAVQSTIRIPLHDNTAMDVMSMKLLGGETHKSRLVQLVAEARVEDPSLPTLQSLIQGIYVDSFGFRICLRDESIALHYMATKLHQFYTNKSTSSIEHKKNWKTFLEENAFIELSKETKTMCRRGIPNSLRSTVWKILINQQVEDLKVVYGRYYFRNLCNTQGGEDEKLYSDVHQKQINLDLLRTMPNNVHFMTANSKGVTQLLQVLHAFCLHNPQIGYCQGMNFLAATALLFVGPEDAFWFLIAVTERYFDKTYFDSNLTGAQADQEVLKELLEVQHPKIMKHLTALDIDVASITLNWFIALFFDAVPFNTLLRIWDCFLLEGPKVLFRFAIVLIGKHEEEIISRNDAIMRVSKAASRLAFDEQAIVDMAFNILNLPTRLELKNLQLLYVSVLAERLEKKTRRANAFVNMLANTFSNEKLISNIFIDEFSPDHGFVVSGHHLMGKIAKIKVVQNRGTMADIDIEFDCRVMSICMVKPDMAYVSLISGYMICAHIGSNDEWSVLWEIKLPDVATCLIHRENTLFAGLANGILTVFENSGDKWPTSVQMWHLPLSSAPLMNCVIHDDLLIVATACKLITLDAASLTTLSTTHVASSSTGSGVFYFDKITCMCESSFGIFLTTDHSTLIQLWQDTTCNLLYDISFDHKTRKPSLSETESSVHVESLLFNDSLLWIGTSDGYVFIYDVEPTDNDRENEVKYRLKKFSTDKRGSRSSASKSCRLESLPEDLVENDVPVVGKEKRASRVSICIDRETQQYSAILKNAEEEQEGTGSSSRFNSHSSKTIRSPIRKGFSADSAVSVFSSEPYTETKIDLIEKSDEVFAFNKKEINKFPEARLVSSTDSSCTSMEFDDTFELYSDEERSRRQIAITSPKRLATMNLSRQIHLKRRDLTFDEPYFVPVPESTDKELASDIDADTVVPSVRLTLSMKIKISDSSVRKIISSGPSHILTCSGEFDADEAVLLWRKDEENNLWINDPVLHISSFSSGSSPIDSQPSTGRSK